MQGRGRIQCETWAAATVANEGKASVNMIRTFGMEGNPGGACFCKGTDKAVHGPGHEMDVYGYLDAMAAEGTADQRTYRQRGDKMLIHDIEMQHVCPCRDGLFCFFAQAGKIGRQEGRRNAVRWHQGRSCVGYGKKGYLNPDRFTIIAPLVIGVGDPVRYFYSFLFYLAMPWVIARLWWRTLRVPGARRIRERLGFGPKDVSGCIWIHAVSLGETIAAIPLVRSLQAECGDVPVLMTSMTATGLAHGQSVLGSSVRSSAVPWDLPDVMARFLRRVRPRLLVLMETELWPNLLAACQAQKVPVAVANGRLSEKSFQGYVRLGGLTRRMLESVRLLLVQAEPDAVRFRKLGMPADRMQVTGSLKFDLALPPDCEQKGQALRETLGSHRPVWVAASTHAGEEDIMLAAQGLLRQQFPDALLILVPRHPERFDSVADRVRASGVPMARRSEQAPCLPETAVYLADSTGEMMLMYAACDIACVAGSFVQVGGHNMIEPAALGRPVITGPVLFNFAEISQAMQAAGGLKVVQDAQGLASQLARWFSAPEERLAAGRQLQAVTEQNRGALKRQHDAICSLLY